MNILKSIKKFIHNPVGIIKRKWYNFYAKNKYSTIDGYNAEAYWTYRLSKYGFELKGAGRSDLSQEENLKMYHFAKEVLLNICKEEKIDFSKTKILDVGCGTGYYAEILKGQGVMNYMGIDITNVLMDQLRLDYTGFNFEQLDISTQSLSNKFDLILMIDVAQHITEEEKFSFAMRNIKSSLSENGLFIVTADLSFDDRSSYYEKSKSMESFQSEFEGYNISEPREFRDKYIFTIKKL